jgi:hypothetical protein
MMMIRSRRHGGAKALLASLALAAFAAAPASAAAPTLPPGGFALSAVGTIGPVVLHGAAGRVLRGTVSVRNLSRHSITVILQRADIENSSNGGADFVTARLYHAGRWLHLSVATVHLAPHAKRQVAYTVSIPALATGASHYAGIVAINAADLITPAVRGRSHGRAFAFYRIDRQALPLTIHLPGPLFRRLALRSVTLNVEPAGAGLVLGLLPGGTELTDSAKVNLRVVRGARTIFTSVTALGQLFPAGGLDYRIPWPGTPSPGTYRVVGTIRPVGSAVIYIDQTVTYTVAKAAELKRETPPVPVIHVPGATPGWMWIALGVALALLIALSLAVWRLTRRPLRALA